jgi:predicted RNA-binding protein with PIN domain
MIGRAMTDIEQMYGHFEAPVPMGEFTLLTGYAPVATMQNYQKEVRAYTKGCGQLSYSLKGYAPCHNTEEVLLETGYIAELDTQNPSSSVFCSHGTGFIVPWNEVPEYMHMPSVLLPTCEEELNVESKVSSSTATVDEWITTEEVDAILAKTYGANKKEKSSLKKSSAKKIISAEAKVSTATRSTSSTALPEYLLVDGYNIIFAWDDLHELSDINMNSAREKLMDILCNYQGIRKCELIVVFDAYRVQGHPTEVLDYHNIHVVYTKEAETADQYIEKFAHEKSKKYRITVATSDGLEQIIIRGQGCNLLSARDFQKEVQQTNEQLRSTLEQQASNRHYLLDSLPEKMKKEIEKLPEHEE